MNKKMDKRMLFKRILTGVLYSLMLLPILNLLMTINGLSGKFTLFFFFTLTLLSAAFIRKGWVFLIIQSGLFFIFIFTLFPPSPDDALIREWLPEMWDSGFTQWQTLLEANLTEVPVLLLMTGLFLLMSVLAYLLFRFDQPLPAFFAALVYLLILHTFTSRTVLPYLILLVGTAFSLVALSQIDIKSRWQTVSYTLLFTYTSIFLLIGLSYFSLDGLEKSQQWVETKSNAYQKELDQRGFFEWINSNATGLGFRRTGMGTGTDRLGGRLHQDFSPVFRAYTQRPNYWKVMHRTTYNGLGWNSEATDSQRTLPIPYTAWENGSLTMEQRRDMPEQEDISTIRLAWFENLSYLAYPYGWLELDFNSAEDGEVTVQLDDKNDYFTVQSEEDVPDDYLLTYDRTFPTRFDEEALRIDDGWREELAASYKEALADDASVQEMESDEIIASWFEDELQLPAGLPSRVGDLAQEITAGLEDEYEIVRAVETYLKEEGGYRYSLLDVERTPEDSDYVDHFLFESQVGYCDNFSTSMAVMLRSLGIPTRWTKGFTPGSLIENDNSDPYFLVDNSNAHSWPEVFFPSYGWVPFEPSPSFANPVTNEEDVASIRGETYSFDDDSDVMDIEDTEPEPLETEEPGGDSLEEESPDAGEGLTESDETASSADQSATERWSAVFYPAFLFIGITVSVIAVFRWHLVLWLPRFLISKDILSLKQASRLILRLYYMKHKPKPGQTVQMYMNDWKPFAPHHKQSLDHFSRLADRAYYGPVDSSQQLTDNEQSVLIEMLNMYPALPNVDARAPHQI
ncbi:Transglutaminase-like superfamily protein [Alkalibacterium putridalgicola]|uniref:Transglutaminase n=1 Tax=Alkalibacterium putridalgicola TaxID=426703 RepID=A0A1H7VEA3_9LACT|nr:transglutaminase-like domain-containing protein [Alkalibacterium putridalgicola]GEK89777.1 transglutaminase [Alkalibacterium putridalgicola]SEM07400.1 Transglutaminase-like superfamily protein [Alkalibacterium putridalgicola]